MAILFMDSFDSYKDPAANSSGDRSAARALMLAGVYSELGSSTQMWISPTQSRTGAQSLVFDAGGFNQPIIRKSLGVEAMTCGVAWAMYLGSLPSTTAIGPSLTWRSVANAVLARVSINTDGTISAYNAAGTLLATSTASVAPSSFNHLEAKVTISSTVGYIEVRLNGETILVVTDLNLGSVPCTQIAIAPHSGTGTPTAYFDDLVIWDDTGTENNDFLGPVRVYTLFADGDLSPVDWAITGATTAHEAVDEVPPDDDTSYIQAGTLDDICQLTTPTLSEDVEVIAAVQISTYGKLSSGGVGSVKTTMINDGDETTGIDRPFTTAYTYRNDIFEIDPSTGLNWDKSGFEAAVIQLKRTI